MIKAFLISTVVLWLLYVWIMTLKQWAKRQDGAAKVLGQILIGLAAIVGYPLDIVYNWIFGSLVFWEWPHKLFEPLTHRLQRYIVFGRGWRYRIAHYLCKYLLHPFDRAHCGELK